MANQDDFKMLHQWASENEELARIVKKAAKRPGKSRPLENIHKTGLEIITDMKESGSYPRAEFTRVRVAWNAIVERLRQQTPLFCSGCGVGLERLHESDLCCDCDSSKDRDAMAELLRDLAVVLEHHDAAITSHVFEGRGGRIYSAMGLQIMERFRPERRDRIIFKSNRQHSTAHELRLMADDVKKGVADIS